MKNYFYWSPYKGVYYINLVLLGLFWNGQTVKIRLLPLGRYRELFDISFSPTVKVGKPGLYIQLFHFSMDIGFWLKPKHRIGITLSRERKDCIYDYPKSLKQTKLSLRLYVGFWHLFRTQNRWAYEQLFRLYLWLDKFNGQTENWSDGSSMGGSAEYGKYTSCYGNELVDVFMIHLPFNRRIFLVTEGKTKFFKIGKKAW